MSLGASGGMYITPAVAEVLINYLAFNDSLEDSIERPRVFFNINTGKPEIEGTAAGFVFHLCFCMRQEKKKHNYEFYCYVIDLSQFSECFRKLRILL